jgi:hypothetical protein
MQLPLPIEAACASAAADGEFKIAARFWNASIRFVCGDETYLMNVRDGSPSVVPNDAAAAPSLTIGAPADVWEKMLALHPAPFYHDVFAASLKHGVTLAPTTEDAATAYYPAVRRFVELMRIARNNHGQA